MLKGKNLGFTVDTFLGKLKPWKILVIFFVIGLVVFFSGLDKPFQNDDFLQIVNNTPVHLITNIPSFFSSSTFFNGEKLTGVYYRPLMTTMFSLIYTFFGAQPMAYHVVQLILYVLGSFFLFLVFKHFFKPIIAIVLALIFLVHPINSQIVYSIPTMQDALLFLFGIMGLWVLINYKSNKGLWVTTILFLLAMFSKESGILFVALAISYLILFDRERIRIFLKVMVFPIVFYFFMKVSAVGIVGAHHAAPINELDLVGRLFTTPSIMLFYFSKFILPLKLSLGYYWVYPTFSAEHVLLPFIIDLIIIIIFVLLGLRVKKKLSNDKFYAFIFFAAWTVIGLGLYLQLIPGLDFTACETWFYLAMAGVLGMVGISLLTIRIRFNLTQFIVLVLVVAIISILGVRSNLRGYEYKSQYNLAVIDLTISDDHFAALNNVSQYLIDNGKYEEAIIYARRSINIYPIVSNYINLGVALQQTGRYSEAISAYSQALKYGNMGIIYENMALIHIVNSKPVDAERFFQKALQEYPHDFKLLVYYAVFEKAIGAVDKACYAITEARLYGSVPQAIYNGITTNQPFSVPILGKILLIK